MNITYTLKRKISNNDVLGWQKTEACQPQRPGPPFRSHLTIFQECPSSCGEFPIAMCRDHCHFYLMNSTDAIFTKSSWPDLTRLQRCEVDGILRDQTPHGWRVEKTTQASENSAGGTRDQWLRSFDHGVEVASHRCLSQAPRPKGGLERWERQAWREIFEMSTWGRVANSSKFSKFQDHWWCLLGCSMRVQPSRLGMVGMVGRAKHSKAEHWGLDIASRTSTRPWRSYTTRWLEETVVTGEPKSSHKSSVSQLHFQPHECFIHSLKYYASPINHGYLISLKLWSTVAALGMLLCPCMSFAGCNRLKNHETLKVHKSWNCLPQEKGHSDLVGGFQILIVVQSTVQKKKQTTIVIWLVVWNIFLFFIFFHNILDNPSHRLIFFKMVKTTNQIMMGLFFCSNGFQPSQPLMIFQPFNWWWLVENGWDDEHHQPGDNLSQKGHVWKICHFSIKHSTKPWFMDDYECLWLFNRNGARDSMNHSNFVINPFIRMNIPLNHPLPSGNLT